MQERFTNHEFLSYADNLLAIDIPFDGTATDFLNLMLCGFNVSYVAKRKRIFVVQEDNDEYIKALSRLVWTEVFYNFEQTDVFKPAHRYIELQQFIHGKNLKEIMTEELYQIILKLLKNADSGFLSFDDVLDEIALEWSLSEKQEKQLVKYKSEDYEEFRARSYK